MTTTKCKENERPNIIIILADDLGFSDIGCFGSEIQTPHIDSLAYTEGGIRFTQFYNCARCCPSRAALLTGKYPHQAGIGHMVYDAGVGVEYQGYLRRDVATIAELLKGGGRREDGNSITENSDDDEVVENDRKPKNNKSGGYATFMVGKWHVGGEYPPDAGHDWVQSTMGDETHPIPTQRGFDEFYGTLGGGGSYYQPPSLVRNQEVVRNVMPEGYFYTDAINDEACSIIESRARENNDDRRPFFLYIAHCAPHW
jgi:arylsulfatase A-like enzyme